MVARDHLEAKVFILLSNNRFGIFYHGGFLFVLG